MRPLGERSRTEALLRLETQAREMLDATRRDDQAVYAASVEDEAQRGFCHRLTLSLGRLSQPLDRSEGFLARIGLTGLRRVSQAAAGRWFLAGAILAAEEPAGERTEG